MPSVRRVESAGLAPEFKKMDENMRIRKECRYLEIIRSLYAMTNEDATIELSDGKEEEIGEDDCGGGRPVARRACLQYD